MGSDSRDVFRPVAERAGVTTDEMARAAGGTRCDPLILDIGHA